MSEMRTRRKLTGILMADVVGYSRLVRSDEENTLRRVKALRDDLINPVITAGNGRIVKLMGDGILAEFGSIVDAMRVAVDIQKRMTADNAGSNKDDRIELRIGINLGDVVIDDDDIYGDGVNVASRLEGIAEPGGICVSGSVYDQIRDRLDLKFEDMGPQKVKNIDRPVSAWKWLARMPEPIKSKALSVPDNPSIVVLPFDNLSGDEEQGYFADGIVEAITAALARIRSFFVIARNTAFTYKGKPTNVLDIGRELGVAYVLEGSVQRLGNRVRITAQLIETEGGTHVWAERYDGTVDDLFDLQDSITEQVVGALQPSIRTAEIERARRKRSSGMGAYDCTMRAMPHVWALEKDESARALELLDQALKIDPKFPLALTLAGWCHAQRSVYFWDDVEKSQAEALRLAEKALQLSGDDPLILAVLGAVQTFVRNYGTARVLLERAIALDPNSAWAYTRLGWLDVYSDNADDSFKHFERSLRLSPMDPLNFNNYVGMASANEVAGNYDEAVELYQRGLQERPNAGWIYRNLTSSLSGAGRMEEAKEALHKLLQVYPDLTCEKVRQAMVFSSNFLERMTANLKKIGLPD